MWVGTALEMKTEEIRGDKVSAERKPSKYCHEAQLRYIQSKFKTKSLAAEKTSKSWK